MLYFADGISGGVGFWAAAAGRLDYGDADRGGDGDLWWVGNRGDGAGDPCEG